MIKRKHAAACVLPAMSSVILRAFMRLFSVRTVALQRREIGQSLRFNLSPAEQLRLPVFFNLPLVPTYLFAPSHVIGYLACVLPAVLRAECVFLLGRAAEFNVPLMRASGASKRSRPLFA